MTLADLTPDALAKLEAKLLSDLEMVRKVRALLLEHEGAQAPVPVVAPNPVPVSFTPSKSREERIQEALTALPEDTFRPDALRRALNKAGMSVNPTHVRAILSSLLAQGKITVAEVGRGRLGSLYRRHLVPSNPSILSTETPINSSDKSI